jgi:hypothetical protein
MIAKKFTNFTFMGEIQALSLKLLSTVIISNINYSFIIISVLEALVTCILEAFPIQILAIH